MFYGSLLSASLTLALFRGVGKKVARGPLPLAQLDGLFPWALHKGQPISYIPYIDELT